MDVQALAVVFQETLHHQKEIRRKAEAQLEIGSKQQGFGVAVLKVVLAEQVSLEVRVAAAVCFKNHVKYHWEQKETDDCPMQEPEKAECRSHIVNLMLSAPPLVRSQLSEALSIISGVDFPNRWPTLLPELTQKLQTRDVNTWHGVLATANSVFKRFRGVYMTDAVSQDLELSQKFFLKPLLAIMKDLAPQAKLYQQTPDALKVVMSCIRLCCRIFYSLNTLGLTEAMDQDLGLWMAEFLQYLDYDNPVLIERDDEKESAQDGVKSAICQNINLLTEICEDDFDPYLIQFGTAVWNLLLKVTPKQGQDNLAMHAIEFLTTVAKSEQSAAKLFQAENVISQICEHVIMPNLRLRDSDEELFDMNPVDYIQRDTEGSDSGTRRRAASDLVRALTDRFPKVVTQLFSSYVNGLLQEHAANPKANWKAKDCAIYLVVALTVKGKTEAQGATSTNELVPLLAFFQEQIVPELEAASGIDEQPILKSDALKFVTTFRSQIPKDALLKMLPSLINLLGASAFVVHSYAATAIERLLAQKEAGRTRFTPEELDPVLQNLLERLFAAFELPESSENQYVMRCIMRVIVFEGPKISPAALVCLNLMSKKLVAVCRNPRVPGFNHYLFESIAALIRHSSAADINILDKVQETLFPPFEFVLQQDVQELHPYIFQIFAQIIGLRNPPLPPVFMTIFPPLLDHTFWEQNGNVPALVRLLQAYFTKAAAQVIDGGRLESILGVFQKLLSSKQLDHHGFYILNAIFEHLPISPLEKYIHTIWTMLFSRLMKSKTTKYVKSFLVFMALFICKHGPVKVMETIENVQQGLYKMILEQVWLPSLMWIRGDQEEKLCAVALIRSMCEVPLLMEAEYDGLWGRLLEVLAAFLEGKGTNGHTEVADPLEEEPQGYSAAFSQLANVTLPDTDPCAEVKDAKQFLAQSLSQLNRTAPGRISRAMQASMKPEVQERLKAYFGAMGVAIS
ncbi:unnamed protein product [Ostreobium quekettii]|uniref:Importin N-terminal domain-containing protein n=1 Tax=Ostreobium quekettii TaxID=121088 RepID=A0A8S1IR20_9CHLO|nr:unnamed protein product [Ostreobium quekettii]|eukprot:evm.model.scf_927.4 EVM.evm.TU.scf_927.4   scf_927:42474-48737(-)